MHTVVVVAVLVLLVIVVTATTLLLRSITASPRQEYQRGLRGIRRYREEIHSRAPDPNATIRVDRDDWLGTSDHLG
jgi:hypothetical protein